MNAHPQDKRPAPRPGITRIDPYVPGRSAIPGKGPVYKLSSNENALGASPRAMAAFREESDRLSLYPDGSARALRQAIAQAHAIGVDNADCIVCGNGSGELLGMLASAYLGAGDEAIYCAHGFLLYRLVILAAGGRPVVVPEKNLTADIDAILGAVTARTKLVFLANPNNPTGTYLDDATIRRLHAGLPANVLLVLDGAYAEFVCDNDYAPGTEIVSDSDNVVMTRTFSKIYGLANLRLGWAYCPRPVADVLNRIRGPFNVSGAALAAGIAAVQDTDHIARSAAHNSKAINDLTSRFTELGIAVTPSVGNFLLLTFAAQGAKTAPLADTFLQRHGVIMRAMNAYGLPHSLRMTIGNDAANDQALRTLRRFMKGEARG